MITITSDDMNGELYEILSCVEYPADRMTVTHYGKAIAAIVSMEDFALLRAIEDRLDGAEALEALHEAEQLSFFPWEQITASGIG